MRSAPPPGNPSRSAGAGITILPDATSVLTIYLLVLYGLPSTLRISALGSMGSMGVLLGLGALLWWAWYRAQLRAPIFEAPRNPVRIGLLIFAGAVLLSYIAAMTRAIPSTEISPADTGLLRAAAMVGVALLALDGPPDRERFHIIVHRFAVAGGLVAALGVVQFASGQSFIDQIVIPGFSPTSDYSSLVVRGGLTRPAGTSLHPLEYAVILSMTLPIAIVSALHASRGRALGLWLLSALILIGIMLSSSRSAFVGLGAALVPLFVGLGRKGRLVLVGGIVGAAGLAYVVAPRAITNLLYLFSAGSSDPSVQSRTSSYDVAEALLPHFALTGRGFGTFLPEYRIFDNEYLLLLMEIGVVGLAALVLLFIAAIAAVLGARRRAPDALTRDLSIALVASLTAAIALLSLFDALSFPQAAGTLFLVIGLCGAYRRLFTPPSLPANSAIRSSTKTENSVS